MHVRAVKQRRFEESEQLPPRNCPLYRVLPDNLTAIYIGEGLRQSGTAVISKQCVQSSHPAVPRIGQGSIYYFEVLLCFISASTNLSAGFIDKLSSVKRQTASSPRTLALKADGHLQDGMSSGRRMCSKLEVGDVIGFGLDFGSKKIFFTKNAGFLGQSVNDIEIKEYFPCVWLSAYGESVTFAFEDFRFDLESYVRQERLKQMAQINQITIPSASVHEIVLSYLAYHGYAETLMEFDAAMKLNEMHVSTQNGEMRCRKVSLKLAETLSLVEQIGKCGVCLNDSDASTCKDCVRHLLGTVETPRTRLPHPSMSRLNSSMSEVSIGSIRSESLDLSSVYMNDFAIEAPYISGETFSSAPGYSANLEKRSEIRRLLMKGEAGAALSYISLNVPQVSASKAIFSVKVQHFLELIRHQNLPEALQFARVGLAPIRFVKVLCRGEVDLPVCVSEITGLLCYSSPHSSPLGYLLSQRQRELTADVINAAMLEAEGSALSSSLSLLLQQYLMTLETLQSTGPLALDISPS